MRINTDQPDEDFPASDDIRFACLAAGVGLWRWDLSTGAIYLSRQAVALLGCAGTRSLDFAGFITLLHHEDRATADRALRRSANAAGSFDLDLRSGGTGQWLRLRGQAFRDAGKPPEAAAILIDAGRRTANAASTPVADDALNTAATKRAQLALQEREAHLRSVLDTVPDAMIVIDGKGIMQSFSTTARRLFGYTEAEAVGQNVSLLMPSPYREQHDIYLARYFMTGEKKVIGRGRVVVGLRRDGSTFSMELAVGEVISSSRPSFTGFVRDLTERQETQRRLQDLQAELIHMSRFTAMGEMASTLAHELNQPLTAVASYLNGCRRLLDGSETVQNLMLRDAIDRAADQALRAGQIIRRLRQFVARGENEHHAEDLPKLIEEASALALVGVRETGVRVSYDFGPAATSALVDKIQIQQVILNLMRNAIEAMQDTPTRELTISIAGQANGLIEISVADTGAGIEPGVAAHLFQPFITTKPHGMGVGLSISRTIVEAHGGKLWAEPNPTGGTVFRMTLKALSKEETADGD